MQSLYFANFERSWIELQERLDRVELRAKLDGSWNEVGANFKWSWAELRAKLNLCCWESKVLRRGAHAALQVGKSQDCLRELWQRSVSTNSWGVVSLWDYGHKMPTITRILAEEYHTSLKTRWFLKKYIESGATGRQESSGIKSKITSPYEGRVEVYHNGNGAPCVMTVGASMMPLLCVGSWAAYGGKGICNGWV